MTAFLDWAGRVAMLALAGMITLSIVGAIASIPSGSIETRIGFEPSPQPPNPAEPQPLARGPAEAQPKPEAAPSSSPPLSGGVAAPAAEEAGDPARWLEAITYALLAIAGLAAFALILLWRALGHWRRSADALETLASRPRG